MHKRVLIATFLLCAILLNGCWDRRELESLGFVQALALDLQKDGKGLTVTTMIAIPPKLAPGTEGGGGGDDSGVQVISMDAPSIYEAFNLINTTVNREVTLVQNQILIFGEDLAKKGVQKWIDNLVRFREMRRTLLIFISKGKAADLLKVKPKIEKNPAEYLSDLVSLSKRTGMFPMTDLQDFLGRYEAFAQQNYAPLLAKYKQKGGEDPKPESTGGEGGAGKTASPPEPEDVRLIGTAVFNKDKVIGSLDIYETQVLQLLTNQFNEAYLTITDPQKNEYKIIFRLLATNPVNITYWQKDVAHFLVKLNLEADIVSIQSDINYTEPDKEVILSTQIARELERRIRKLISKTQNKYQSDIFGFGVKVRNTMLTSTDWDNYHWPDKYSDSIVHVKVKVNVRRVGVQFQPPEDRN